jgi:hypothetical protein
VNPLLLGGIFDIGGKVLDRLFPDPAQRAKAQLELAKLEQEGAFKQLEAQLQVDLAQANINAVEATSDSLFKSGWRPATGWVCVAGLFYEFLLRPLLPWALAVYGAADVPPMPSLEAILFELVFALLGLGMYRSYEKKLGVMR